MKNPKVIYILVGVFCVLAIIAGIYAQFFIKDEDKDNIILPSFNTTSDDQVVEKTAEEVKTQFSALFTNVLNKGEYDTSTIQRIVEQNDIVYSAYDIQDKKDNYEIDIHLPVMNIQGEVPNSFNKITQDIFANKASEIMKSQSTVKTLYQIDYVSYINGDILSLIIRATLKEGDNPQRVIVQTYNYNLATGQKVRFEDVLSYKNLVQSEVQTKIQNTIQKAKEEAEILVQSGYTVYNRDLNDSMYQLGNIANYFLGPNGDLYIVFAYGNGHHTAEMDIVLYENKG
ncbi:MAG: hypothetical protein HFJ30_05405 [Clostridia bacterium]|jgi:hypothetical protein|nr:hypothetical protein [Clostridia bacterium]